MGNRLITGRCAPFLALLLSCTALPALAMPYWIAWEGDDWPENQGWTRDILGGGDARTLEGGMMTLDGLDTGPGFVWDAYERFRPGAMDPGPGETFVMQWRMRVDAVTEGNWDPLVYVYSNDAWAVSLSFSTGQLWSRYEGIVVPISPSVFNSYELRSATMRAYDLYVNGALTWTGTFVPAVTPAWLGWGDGGSATRSSSCWDFVRFGCVPEPSSIRHVVLLAVLTPRVRRVDLRSILTWRNR